MKKMGINLTGGGARGSYQAGVLLALGETINKHEELKKNHNIRYWSGSSAGAINAAFCASQSEDLYKTTQDLARLWKDLEFSQVFHTDLKSLSGNSARWIRDLTLGSLFKEKLARSLLNSAPLLDLLKNKIPFEKIQTCLDKGLIEALSCTTYCYNDARTVTFIQSNEEVLWKRPRRISQMTKITAEHVQASCSIPLLFPPMEIGEKFYGDGGFRNTSPVSPSIHMGSKKILMIGVRSQTANNYEYIGEPGVAKIAGSMLNALFFDTIDVDLERINHINEIVTSFQHDVTTKRSDYTHIDIKMIRPSLDIARIAEHKSEKSFPRMIDFLMRGLGTREDTADIASYILFDSSFTKELIDLGYCDFMAQKEEFLNWAHK